MAESYPRLEGKVVLITGASAGIGAAAARHFIASGAKVIVTARRLERLDKLKAELEEKFPGSADRVHAAKLDVQQHAMVDALVVGLPEAFKDIDILVNNAGLALGVPQTHENDPAAIDTVLDTNVKGVLYMIRAVVPGMIARKSGHVINVSSVAGIQAYRGGSLYCASKHAVQAITNSMRKELAPHNVKVTAICPGLVETEFSIVRLGDKDKADQVYKGYSPLVADDIADNILYAASRPAHVQIAELLVYPSVQASAEIVHKEL